MGMKTRMKFTSHFQGSRSAFFKTTSSSIEERTKQRNQPDSNKQRKHGYHIGANSGSVIAAIFGSFCAALVQRKIQRTRTALAEKERRIGYYILLVVVAANNRYQFLAR
jgi:hypothetical protein